MGGSICPKDFKPCIDGLCRSGGCLKLGGEPLYEVCNCGHFVSSEDRDDCTCIDDPEFDYDPEEGD